MFLVTLISFADRAGFCQHGRKLRRVQLVPFPVSDGLSSLLRRPASSAKDVDERGFYSGTAWTGLVLLRFDSSTAIRTPSRHESEATTGV